MHKNHKDQSHLAVSGIAAKVLFGGRGSCIGLAIVPLDRVLLIFYMRSVVTICYLMVWLQFAMQILTGEF